MSISWMFYRWWKRRRRHKLVSQPFPVAWHKVLQANVWLYRRLSELDQARVRSYLPAFIAEKYWEGCRGFVITDEVKVTIAAQVAILVLGFRDEYFERVLSILVYPDSYVAPEETLVRAGVVMEASSAREGEAWYRGPVILSWPDVLEGTGGENEGDNLVLHEFAHQLDFLNGHNADGVPPMESAEQYRQWSAVLERNFKRLVRDCEHGRRTLLDCYGATNMSEFFAVATERFFQCPVHLRRDYPDLYDVLRDFYHQDPALTLV